jgi:hypothetical protein
MDLELFPVIDILTLWKESLGLAGRCRPSFVAVPKATAGWRQDGVYNFSLLA